VSGRWRAVVGEALAGAEEQAGAGRREGSRGGSGTKTGAIGRPGGMF
jgi:hypothetical protein